MKKDEYFHKEFLTAILKINICIALHVTDSSFTFQHVSIVKKQNRLITLSRRSITTLKIIQKNSHNCRTVKKQYTYRVKFYFNRLFSQFVFQISCFLDRSVSKQSSYLHKNF